MTVTLLRHYKVLHTRPRSCTPSGYRETLRAYDDAGVLDQHVTLPQKYTRIITSSLRRTALTRDFLFGAVDSESSALLDEVPLAPFTDAEREFDPTFLDVMARIQWLANNPRQPETREQSLARARMFVDTFLREDHDYLLIGHGFFFRILSAELLRRGFAGRPVRYLHNGESRVYRRAAATEQI